MISVSYALVLIRLSENLFKHLRQIVFETDHFVVSIDESHDFVHECLAVFWRGGIFVFVRFDACQNLNVVHLHEHLVNLMIGGGISFFQHHAHFIGLDVSIAVGGIKHRQYLKFFLA